MDYYSWLKAAHVFVVFVFVGGMFLNGFLLLNVKPGTPQTNNLLAAARRWNGIVTGSALALVWIFGLTLGYLGNWFADGWLSTKMILVLALSALHGFQSGAFRRLQASSGTPLPFYLRHSAALTAIFLAAIAILVIVKPF